MRRAVYEATPGGWRIAAHERVAGALAARGAPAMARAPHVERSARAGDGEAIAVLREAGEESAFRAPAAAARVFGAAVRLLPASAAPSERVALLLAMAQALAATGQFADSHATLLESIEIVPPESTALRTQLAATCARVEHILCRHQQAHDRLVRALEALPDEISPEGVSLMVELAMDGVHRMNYATMRDWGERAAAAAEQLDDPALLALALAVRARGAAVSGATAEAATRLAQATAAVDALPDRELARRLDAAMYLAGAELYLHHFSASHDHAQRLLAIGRATGQGQLFPLVYSTVGVTLFLLGRPLQAVEPLDGAIEAARLTANTQALAWSLYTRAKIALAVGDVELALSAAQEAVDITDDGTPSHHNAHAAFALAEAHFEIGKLDRAIELLERSAGGPDMPLAAESFKSTFLELLTRCRLADGDRAAAERAARCALEAAQRVDLPLALSWAQRAQAAVALDAGDAAGAADLALRAVGAADGAGAPLEAALARALAGRALAQHGDVERGCELLEQAAGEFERRGALRYRDQAQRELRRLGQRIHRRSQPTPASGAGVDSLTRRELEIARLIVDRRTNREIAEDLVLSPKTVETHIRNIFAKLGASSRVEVARMVERADRLAGSAT